jgi:cation:H+ antiporter
MILEFGLLILSMIFIALSSEKAVKYVSGLSNMLKISGTAAGFIILSVSTSLPELFVAIQSALTNVSNFSVGNVFGANISNITLVIGLAAILSKKEVIFRKKVHDELIKYLFISK